MTTAQTPPQLADDLQSRLTRPVAHHVLAAFVLVLAFALAGFLWFSQTGHETRMQQTQVREYARTAAATMQADLQTIELLLRSLADAPQPAAQAELLQPALLRWPVAAIFVRRGTSGAPIILPAPAIATASTEELSSGFTEAAHIAGQAGLPGYVTEGSVGHEGQYLVIAVVTRSGNAAGLALRAEDWVRLRTGNFQGWFKAGLLTNASTPSNDNVRVWSHDFRDIAPALRLQGISATPDREHDALLLQCLLVVALGFAMAFVLQRSGMQRLQAEAAVDVAGSAREASERRLRRALELSRDGVWELDPVRGTIYLSPQARKLLDIPAEIALTPRAALLYLPRHWRRELIARLRTTGVTGETQELRLHLGDSLNARWLRLRVRALEDQGVRLLTGSLADISEEMQQAGIHERYRAMLMRVIDALPVPIALHGADQTLLMMNERYATRMLLPLQEIAHQPEYDRLRQHIEELGLQAITTGEPQSLEAWLPMLDGEMRYLRISRALCDGLEGEPNVVASFEDITEPTMAAQQIRAERRFFQRLIDNLPNPTFVKDAQHRYTLTNQAHALDNGTTTQDIIGKRSSDFTPEAAADIEMAEDALLAAPAGTIVEQEMSFNRHGDMQYVILRKVHVDDGEGNHVLLCTSTDITRMRETEESLRRQSGKQAHLHSFLQSVLNAVPHPLFVKDRQHRYLISNRAHAETVGAASVDEVIGKRSSDFVDAEVAAAIEAAEDALFADGGTTLLNKEYVLPHRNGDTRYVILCKALCIDADGQRVLVGVNTDITHLREVEEGLRQHRDQLAQLVRSQTMEIVRANEIVEQARETRASFLGHASAALRGPLNDILQASRELDASLHPETLQHIHNRCAALVDQIAALSRSAMANKLEGPLALRPASLTHLLHDVAGEFQVWLQSRQMQLVIEEADETPPVLADKALLCRALRLLIQQAASTATEGSSLRFQLRTTGGHQSAEVELCMHCVLADAATPTSIWQEAEPFLRAQHGKISVSRGAAPQNNEVSITASLPACVGDTIPDPVTH
ncbi:PAS domain-containing protein [Viridibacterium curvum]|uniref:PAS domain S-box protein n=1 Tax=Viridibacterium curvum TaxID=1101404 RepID=A0ABP9QYX3_9RHOO